MRVKTFLLAVAFAAFVTSSGAAYAESLGTFGAVYEITEPDALEEIKTAVAKVDWGKTLNREKWAERMREYKPKNLLSLPRAIEDKTFLVDMTYKWDGPDIAAPCNMAGSTAVGAKELKQRCEAVWGDDWRDKNVVLYPTGYEFNPLDQIKWHKRMVVINGGAEEQVKWFELSEYSDEPATVLLISDGSWYELSKRLKRPVFYAEALIVEKFNLSALPSIIRQNGNMMEVREINIVAKSEAKND